MKKNGFIEKVKNIGLFCKFDLIIYLLIAIIIVSLFLVFALRKNNDGIFDKITIESNNQIIFTYSFNTNSYTLDNNWNLKVLIVDNTNDLLVTIFNNEQKTEFNEIVFDKLNKKVYVKDSNCSIHKDCVYMDAITKCGDSIICLPRLLKIVAIGGSISEPVTG